MKTKNILITIGVIILVAGLGTLFSQLGMGWYEGLTKATEWIPSWVIPVIWTIIYLAFAIVLSVWQNFSSLTTENIILLLINGGLNVLWCLVFFTLNQLFLGVVVITINTLFALRLYFEICKQRSLYGLILSIYPIWLSIASTLNIALWILN